MVDQVSTSPLPPVPSQQGPLQDTQPQLPKRKGEETPQLDLRKVFFNVPWIQWFVALREKVNLLNASVAAISEVLGDGIVSVDETTGEAFTRTITGTAGEINVADGDGVAGNPTISIIATGITPGSYHGITFDADGRATAVNVVYTVATLPAGANGNTAFVTDSTVAIAAGLGLAPVGGGAFGVPVFHDGAGWKIG